MKAYRRANNQPQRNFPEKEISELRTEGPEVRGEEWGKGKMEKYFSERYQHEQDPKD